MVHTFETALDYYNKGNLAEAEKVLSDLAFGEQKNYDSNNLLGLIYLHQQQFEKAAECFDELFQIFPEDAEINYHYGYALQQLKKYDEAISFYELALLAQPGYSDALNNLGLIYFEQNKIAEAEEKFLSALQFSPDDPKIYNNLGNLFFSKDDFSKAEEYYNLAVNAAPSKRKYLKNLAACLNETGRFNQAFSIVKRLLDVEENVEVLNLAATILIHKKEYEEAERFLDKIFKIQPNDLNALYTFAKRYEHENDYVKAIEVYTHIGKYFPTEEKALVTKGILNLALSNKTKAEEIFEIVFDNKETKIASLADAALIYFKYGKLSLAKKLYEYLLQVEPSLIEIHYNYSHLLILQGEFNKGWAEYEYRRKRKDFLKRNFSKPELINQEINGKRILICDEQGIGDIIQFIRYAKLLKQKEAYIIFQCASGVYNLIKNVEGIDEFIIRKNDEEPAVEYDYFIYLMSLPFYFKTTVETIPCEKKYLKAEIELTKKWSNNFKNYSGLKVGIVWAGNPNHSNDIRRSLKLKTLKSLFNLKGVDFFSIQKGAGAEQASEFANKNFHNLNSYINSLSDTAAIIENLDLVISVDTSVAHLAGALNKPVWLLLPYVPDWRWLWDSTVSPWYPSIKIFKQNSPNAWHMVVDELIKELKEFSGSSPIVNEYKTEDTIKDYNLYLALSEGKFFGWGICSDYLRKELKRKINYFDFNPHNIQHQQRVNGKVFHAISNIDFNTFLNVKGKINFGYTFFETEPNEKTKTNAANFDLIFTGSTWCKEKLEQIGINNTSVLIQGIDPEIFYPLPPKEDQKLFVIFSGGKFELRKGQDLVLKAFSILHNKYPDMILVNAWYNFWPHLISGMSKSKYIKFVNTGKTWQSFVENLLIENDIDPSKVITLPVTPNDKLPELYGKTDIGLFSNRCEGGTNLVLMEYMACGKPVIVSNTSGHKDIVNENNSLLLNDLLPFRMSDNNKVIYDWQEPSLDEIISKIEYAYLNRDKIKSLGIAAGEHLKSFTWENTAVQLLNEISKY